MPPRKIKNGNSKRGNNSFARICLKLLCAYFPQSYFGALAEQPRNARDAKKKKKIVTFHLSFLADSKCKLDVFSG